MTDLTRTLTRFPLPAAALSFAAGICHGRFGPAPTAPLTWFLSLFGLAVLLHQLTTRHRRLVETISLIGLFYLAGIIHLNHSSGFWRQSVLDSHLDTGEAVILSGHLATAPSYDGTGAKFLLQADQWWRPNGDIISLAEPIQLTTPFPIPTHLEPGYRLLVRATLHRPQPPGTPGSFDYRQYLADRGIHSTGYLRSPACLAALHLSPPEEGRLHTLRFWPQQLRQKINLFLATSPLSQANIGLYQALLTGELGLVPPKVLTDFRTSGAFHLLSISGTHLGLLGLLCGLGLNLLLRRSRYLLLNFSITKITGALTSLVLLLYALLAGMNPPVVRSLIMALSVIAALMLNRPHSLLNSLGLAMLLSLLWCPTDLFSASFQLSYAAIAGIVALHTTAPGLFAITKTQQSALSRLTLWLKASLAVSLAALLATAPLTKFHFQQVALIGPLSTLLLSPLLCLWALPLGLIAVTLSGWQPEVAIALLQLGGLALSGADWLNSALAALPLSSWQHAPLPLAAIPLYYLFIAALLCSRKSQTARITAGGTLILLILVIMFPPGATQDADKTRITFLDVGQGSSTLLELPGGRNLLVDGGCITRDDYDVGAQVIVPFLRQRGIRELEALVISHDHGDHFNGLGAVINEFSPRTLWVNGGQERSPELTALLAQAVSHGAITRIPAAGETLVASSADRLTCLGNQHLQPATLPENRRSLVLQLTSQGKTFLLPGDIMVEEGIKLAKAGDLGACNVLLAPHHGSDNSASLVLAESGRPNWLVVSAGDSETGKFPGPKLREWCKQNGTSLHQTGIAGALTFTVGPEGLSWRRLSAKAAIPPAGPSD
ncbi:MAG: DNA internalization-related competence protein ComEC/Rec2 [Desulfobulbaceae bacterium]|nr:DNA internalization-related competence protein ComEC/Rec2 [Desulfobulbaceae bacterium]